MCAVVTMNIGVRNSVRLSQLFLVIICKRSINSITNAYPVYRHLSRDNNFDMKIIAATHPCNLGSTVGCFSGSESFWEVIPTLGWGLLKVSDECRVGRCRR
jgi:hypothetical protein